MPVASDDKDLLCPSSPSTSNLFRDHSPPKSSLQQNRPAKCLAKTLYGILHWFGASVSAKKYWLSLIGLMSFMLIAGYHFRLENNADFALYYTLIKQISQDDDCVIPNIDPWDASIQKYLSKADSLVCKRLQYELTYMSPGEGRIYFNTSELQAAGYDSWEEISCQYRCFDRAKGDDVTLQYGQWNELKNGSQPGCEFVEAKCYKSYQPVAFYTNLHSQIIPLSAKSRSLPKKLPGNKRKRKPASVLLFVVDSVSNSNWQRNLPKTLNVLKDDYNSFIFNGFTKIGDNSFPNAVSFLTGKRVMTPGCESELRDDMSRDFFDEWPIVWKDFKKEGYTTFYAEDYPQFNLFKYLSNGFREKPTDHYFRPYWLQLYGSFLHRRSTHLCYGNQPCHKLQLSYLRDFVEKYNSANSTQMTFALNWLTELGHDWLNQVGLGDDDLADFFHTQKENLKDSFVFVFSDHGHRFDPIRQSLIGRIEERMPFFSMHVPEWLMKENKELRKVIHENSQKLVSFWDLYISLRDILDMHTNNTWSELDLRNKNSSQSEAGSFLEGTDDYQPLKRFRQYSKRGLSLLRPLPKIRNCDSAGVPEDFCICQREQIVNVSNPKVKSAAHYLIQHINAMLADYSNECAKLELKGIHNAQTFLPNLRMVMDPNAKAGVAFSKMNPFSRASSSLSTDIPRSPTNGFYVNYRVTIEAYPSLAIFEGTIQNHVLDNTYTVVGDVSRINKYGNQSVCVNSAILRKYCYCK
ncbi:hypothetical protein Ddc_12892 [Ditylenchus destructor]|nr:hypothetical protein Ddc_12892 [Ditylenchus destructor]